MTHIIQKQILELTLDEGPERVALHDDMVRRFKESVIQELGKLFDKIAPEHLIYKIDKLEVDLGRIAPEDFEKELLRQIKKLLQTQLKDESNTIDAKVLMAISKEQSVFQQFLFFLKNGHFSWNANGISLAQMEAELPAIFSTLTETERKELLHTIAENPSLERLKIQFSKEIHSKLVAALLPFKELKVWKKVFKAVLPKSISLKVNMAALTIYSRNLHISEIEFIIHLFKLLTVDSKFTDKETITLRKAFLAEAKNAIPEKVKSLADTFKDAQSTDLKSPEEDYFSESETTEEMSSVIYIKNAGLILLWPYLSSFFGNIKLANGNKFKDRLSTEKAVRTLHFLVSPDEPLAENLLPLSKVLCGLDVNDLVPTMDESGKPFTINATEMQAGKELIKAVVQNWKTIGSTSLEVFQTSFLQREGRMENNEQGWKLKVEQRPFDVLMNSLPWSINLIKLPWMPKPLHVEW